MLTQNDVKGDPKIFNINSDGRLDRWKKLFFFGVNVV